MPIPFPSLLPLYIRYAVKVGIACLAAYCLSFLIGSHYAVWAVVSTIIAMQVNVAESLLAGINRIIGTVVGAASGVLLLLVLPKDPYSVGAGVLGITCVYAYLARYGTRWSSASIAAVIVLLSGAALAGEGYEEAVTFGLLRVAEILIGVGCAFAVGLLLWPVRLLDTLRADIGLQYHECARLTDALVSSFLTERHGIPTELLESVESKAWSNHERLNKTRKHESLMFRRTHGIVEVQTATLDRVVEHLRTLAEALNDYADEPGAMPPTPEIRSMADAVMDTLRHIGGDNPTAPAPDLVRGLTLSVGMAEARLNEMRAHGGTRSYPLHSVLQFFTFCQTLRQLVENLLLALDRLESLNRSKTAYGAKN